MILPRARRPRAVPVDSRKGGGFSKEIPYD